MTLNPDEFRFDPIRVQRICTEAVNRAPEPLRSTLFLLAAEHGVDIMPMADRPDWVEFTIAGSRPIAWCPAYVIEDPNGQRDAYVSPDGEVSANTYDRDLVAAIDEVELMMGDDQP